MNPACTVPVWPGALLIAVGLVVFLGAIVCMFWDDLARSKP